MRLMIAEKPSVAMDIARIIGGFSRHDGYLESKSNNMIISWAVGHLIGLAMPEKYDPAYEKWDMAHLPIMPDVFMLAEKSATRRQLKILRTLIINRKDVTSLINACDAGREGELIFRYIIEHLRCGKPHERLWLSETTDNAVRNAMNNLRPGSSMDNLAYSAKARSQADWLVGINATRGYTVQHNSKITVGRVQTPTLALLVQRQEEINSFVPVPYYEVHTEFSGSNKYIGQHYRMIDGKAVKRNNTKDEAQTIASKVAGQSAIITDVSTQLITQHPPQLYSLNELQKDANKKYGYTATETLAAAQKLYEKKLVTYPRTDSRYLTEDMALTLPGRINALQGADLDPLLPDAATADIVNNKRYTDNSKVTDHTAIILTAQTHSDISLSDQETKIYWLIAKRTLAIFFPPARYNKTKITTTAAGETFITNAREVINIGWRAVLSAEPDEDNELPALTLTEGDTAAVIGAEVKELQTKPPKPHTESDILTQMEKYNLGTPATRAGIIEKIISVGYAQRSKKNLIPTEKGVTVIRDIISPALADVDMTAEWERKLESIATGNYSADEFLREIKTLVISEIEKIKKQEVISMEKTIGTCPICGKPITESPKAYGCSGYRDGCKFVIWKKVAGKKITPAHVTQLLTNGETELIAGFVSKTGKNFDAKLGFDKKQHKVEFKFNTPKPIGICPVCNKPVVETHKSYGCSGYRDGCKFVIWKEMAGKKISELLAKQLLLSGKTSVIKGFKSRAGKEFDAILVVEDGEVTMEFPD